VPKGYCAAHQRDDNRRYYERRRADPLLRVRDAFYKTAAWLRLRAWRLSIEPLCRMCKALGLITSATLVDHIVPISQDWIDGWILKTLNRFAIPAMHESQQSKDRAGEAAARFFLGVA
jgi:5-methylcytosine-specific restriction enzyme A